MRSNNLLTIILAYSTVVGASAKAEDNVQLFKRFLGNSNRMNVQAMQVSQSWLREIAQDSPARPVAPVRVSALRQPIWLAARAEPTQPTESPQSISKENGVSDAAKLERLVDLGTDDEATIEPQLEAASHSSAANSSTPPLQVADQGVPAEETTEPQRSTMADVLLPLAQPKPSVEQTADVTDLVMPSPFAAVAQTTQPAADDTLQKQVENLQKQLEAEEKRLTAQLSAMASRRTAALEAQDEETLAKLEQDEQRIVMDYERRIERLLTNSLPREARTLDAPPMHSAPQSISAPSHTIATPPAAPFPTLEDRGQGSSLDQATTPSRSLSSVGRGISQPSSLARGRLPWTKQAQPQPQVPLPSAAESTPGILQLPNLMGTANTPRKVRLVSPELRPEVRATPPVGLQTIPMQTQTQQVPAKQVQTRAQQTDSLPSPSRKFPKLWPFR